MRALLALLFCCIALPCLAQQPAGDWISPLGRDHPLAGRIWLPVEARFAGPDEVIRRLASADFMLLGERHDNADHHRLQAWALQQIVDFGRRPVVAFEMIAADKQDALDGALRAHPEAPDDLAEAVGWATSGWPDWRLYRPLFAEAMTAHLPLRPANLSAESLRAVARRQDLSPALRRLYRLDQPLDERQSAAMAEEIRQTHCGMLPEPAVAGMVDAQRARDAVMARAMDDAPAAGQPGGNGALLIAGAGHVRTDRGVPFHLAALAPGRTVFALAFVEVDDSATDPATYAETYGAERLPFDAVWFTPRANDDDPCAEMAAFMKKKAPK